MRLIIFSFVCSVAIFSQACCSSSSSSSSSSAASHSSGSHHTQYPELIQYTKSDIEQNLASSPPALILRMVEQKIKEGVDPKTIVVAFDFDGTVLGKSVSGSNPMKGYVRWEKAMFELLDTLKKNGVTFVIDTASKATGIVSIASYGLQNFGLNKYFMIEKSPPKAEWEVEKDGVIETTAEGEKIYAWGKIISGSDGYDKPAYLDAYMKANDINPNVIIFIDDSAHNVLEMRKHYVGKKIPFVGIHVPLVDLETPRQQALNKLIETGDESLLTQIKSGEPQEGENVLIIKREIEQRSAPKN